MTKPRNRHRSPGGKTPEPSKGETDTEAQKPSGSSTTPRSGPEAGKGGGKGGGREKKKRAPITPAGRELAKIRKDHRDAVDIEKQALAELLEEVQTGSRASPFDDIIHPEKRAYLTAFALLGTKIQASRAVGLSAATVYSSQWADDRQFQAGLARARVMAADIFEHEAYRRAVEGVEEPTGWYMGQPGGVVRRYSDVLLIFTIKALLPERYRERVDLRASLAHIDLKQLPDELLARIAAGEHPFSVLAPGQDGAPVLLRTGPTPAAPLEESEDVTDKSADIEDTSDVGSR